MILFAVLILVVISQGMGGGTEKCQKCHILFEWPLRHPSKFKEVILKVKCQMDGKGGSEKVSKR